MRSGSATSLAVGCMWLGSDGVDAAVEKYGLQKVSLLRALCKSVGIQVLLREYSLDGKTRQSFYEEDIQTVFPIVKHVHPKVKIIIFKIDVKPRNQHSKTSATQGGEQQPSRRAALCTEGLSRLNCCHTWRSAIESTAPA